VELERVMKSAGQNPTQAELDKLIEEVDADGNGEIDFEEFLECMARQIKDTRGEEGIIKAFKILDKDKNGFITVQELRHFMSMPFNGTKLLTDEEINLMIKEAKGKDSAADPIESAGNDNQINYEEFVKRVMAM